MRYFIEFSYLGRAYCGWQRQSDVPSVQQTLERRLSTLLREQVEVVGAGRTDTGVNASYYVAHFDSDNVVDCNKMAYKLNCILPEDIAIGGISPVANDAHARFSAVQREYTYLISPNKNPFTRHLSWQYYVALDVDAMNNAAEKLLHFEDFTTFAKLNSNNKTNICHVTYARWIENNGVLCFTIRADRFLRNMVRAIVGTLVDVGRGRYTPEEFGEILHAKNLSLASGGAPAEGLFLSDVRYPEELFVRGWQGSARYIDM